MELLKNLSEAELTSLKDRFLRARNHALTLDEFDEVLTEACASKPNIDASTLHLRELFNDIDVNGDNTVSWDEFTMFLISGEPLGTESAFDDGREIKGYNHVKTIVGSEIPNSVVETRYIPKLDKALRIMRREKSSRLRLCYPNTSLTTYLEVPRTEVPILSAEYIPFSTDVQRSGSVAVSFSDCVVRFYETRPSTSPTAALREMPMFRETKLSESQTIIRWSTLYNRLVMGSRTGSVSVLDIDQSTIHAKEKLHNLLVSGMALSDNLMFTSSLDTAAPVKCVDLEQSVVRFTLDGHAQGSTGLAVSDYHNQLLTAGFELFVLAYSVALPRLKPYKLDDPHRPHKGKIVGLQAVPGSPQVITADTTGLVKVWDLRMYNCVQNIWPSKDDTSDVPSQGHITSIGFFPTLRRLIVNGRDTTLYSYDDTGDPFLSDDHNCTTAVYNPKSHSFLSVHDSTIKLWDAVSGATRLVQRDIVPTDITCICLATPLCRRFFAGTMSGKLYNIGYAMGTVLRVYEGLAGKQHTPLSPTHGVSQTSSSERGVGVNLSPLMSAFLPQSGHTDPFANAIVCLYYMESFRDTDHQYVVVGMGKNVVLVPDAEEHVQRSILPLHCLDDVLTGSTLVTNVSVMHSNFVIASTSDGLIHVTDLTSFSRVFSYGKNVLRGELSGLWVQSIGPQSNSSQVGPCVVFVSDASGNVNCALAVTPQQWVTLKTWVATGHSAHLVQQSRSSSSGGGTEKDTSLSHIPEKTSINGGGSRRAKKGSVLREKRVSLMGCDNGDFVSSSANPFERRLSSRLVPNHPRDEGAGACASASSSPAPAGVVSPAVGAIARTSSVVREYFRADRKDAIFRAFVSCLAYSSEEQILIVGDDRGYIAVWDVAPLVRHALALESQSYAFPQTSSPKTQSLPLSYSVPTSHKSPPSPVLIKHWGCHTDEVRSVSLFKRSGKTCVLSASQDKTIQVSSLDGVSLGILAQGRLELEDSVVSGDTTTATTNARIQPFRVSNVPSDAWAHFDAFVSSRSDNSNELVSDVPVVSSASFGHGSHPSSVLYAASIPSVPPMPPKGERKHSIRKRPFGSASSHPTVFLTGINEPPSGGVLISSGAQASGETPLTVDPLENETDIIGVRGRTPTDTEGSLPISPRLKGIVKADALKRCGAQRAPRIPPLSQASLPPISPRGRKHDQGGDSAPAKLSSSGSSDFMRLNLCATSSALPSPRQISLGPSVDTFRSPRTARRQFDQTPTVRTGVIHEYLRAQGHDENPFETMKERALRTKGSVVLGSYTEASNRVV